MKRLYDEVLSRFPEVAAYVSDGDEDLPYLVVGYVAEWLRSIAKPKLNRRVAQRVVDFDRWCMEQPRGESAADDVMTIEVVALREKLFEDDALLPLVPMLMSRDELEQSRHYLSTWVGSDRFEAALRMYDGTDADGIRRGRKRRRPYRGR
jgi:hypothetical protein